MQTNEQKLVETLRMCIKSLENAQSCGFITDRPFKARLVLQELGYESQSSIPAHPVEPPES